MRRHTLFLLVCFLILAERVHAQQAPQTPQESTLGAEFRREKEAFSRDCLKFSFKSLPGCGQVLFTGKPLHVAVGSIAPGNGFGVGPAFVTHWTPNEIWRLNFNTDGLVSTNGSWRAGFYGKAVYSKIEPGTTTIKPYPLVNFYAQAASVKKIAYYGLGQDTKRPDETFFGIRETIVGANLVYPVLGNPLNMSLRGELNGRYVDIRESTGQRSPSIGQIHTETSAPGLSHQPAFAQFGEGIQVRPALLNDVLRLNYSLNFQQFAAIGESEFSFRRLTLDLTHQIPLSRTTTTVSSPDQTRPDDCSMGATGATGDCPATTRDREGSIVLRLLASESFTSEGSVVPFYFQPTLGGSDLNGRSALAGFQDYRFRAPNLLLLQGAIEHSLYGPLGLTFLAETGKVAQKRGDIKFKHLVHSYGAGLTLRAGGFPMISFVFNWGSGEGTHTVASMNSSLLGGSARPAFY